MAFDTATTRTMARFVAQIVLFVWICLPEQSVRAQTLQIETQELVFPHMAVGGGWESELTLVAQGADTASGDIMFLAQDGSAMVVSINGGPEVTGTTYFLRPKMSRTFRLTSNAPTHAGWVIVTSKVPGNTSHGSINGALTYRFRERGIVSSQVGIQPGQAVTRAHLPFDETNNNMTAFAVASLNRLNLDVEHYDEAGALRETRSINFGQYTQQALYVHELFPSSMNTRGLLVLKGSAPFNMAALNTNQDNWSGLAVLPGVLERDLTLGIGELSSYRVRLSQNGTFLYGVAEMVSPQQNGYRPISGSLSILGTRTILQLNLSSTQESTGQSLTIALIAPVSGMSLSNTVSGRATVIKEDGSTAGTGTFTLAVPQGAQF